LVKYWWNDDCPIEALKVASLRKVIHFKRSPHPTVVSHLAVVVGLCTDNPKDFKKSGG